MTWTAAILFTLIIFNVVNVLKFLVGTTKDFAAQVIALLVVLVFLVLCVCAMKYFGGLILG